MFRGGYINSASMYLHCVKSIFTEFSCSKHNLAFALSFVLFLKISDLVRDAVIYKENI